MKKTINSYFKPSKTLMILSLAVSAVLGTVSCQKDIAGTASGDGVVTISVNGIKENNMGMPVSFASESNVPSNGTSKSIKISGINAEVFSGHQDDHLLNADGTRSTKSVSPMAAGTKYRIVLFKGTEFYKQFPMESNVAEQIHVEVGVDYNWIAYSYNSDVDTVPSYDVKSPVVPATATNDLLFSKGTIQTNGEALDTKVEITFEHKVSMVRVEVNTTELYGDITALDANVEEAPYYKTGTFNLVTGEMEYGDQIDTKSIPFNFVDSTNQKIKESVFYTANNIGLNKVKLNINKLEIINPKGVTELLIDDATKQSVEFDYTDEASAGVKYIGRVALWRVMKPKKIIHLSRNDYYGYAGFEKASRNLLDEPKNFGTTATSKVKVGRFTHVECNLNGELMAQLMDPNKPDIIIMNVYYLMTTDEVVELNKWINDGGVLLLGSDEAGGDDTKKHVELLNLVFNTTNIEMLKVNGGGAVYPFIYRNDIIMNGPFGNLKGQNWGEDASKSRPLMNIPPNKVFSYSDGTTLNMSPANGITTFRHKTKNIFWIADGGWISNEKENGTYDSKTLEPFATDGNNYPVIKYAYGSSGNGHAFGSMPVANSILFANVMNWACIQAEFTGVNSK